MSEMIKIIAYNIEYAKSATPAAIAGHLKPANPDIICFSEVPQGDWTAEVGQKLGMNYCYVGNVASANHLKEYPDQTGQFYGKFKSILSKTPLTEPYELLLNGSGWQPASVVMAHTVIHGLPLLIGSLHIPTGVKAPSQSCAADLAKQLKADQDANIIISGDYNDLANAAALQYLYRTGFSTAWQESGFELQEVKTCNAKSEEDVGVIDHILYRGRLQAVNSGIIKSAPPLSDHYAIWAEILLNPKA